MNPSTRLPYDLGASASGEGATIFGAGGTAFEVVALAVLAVLAAFAAGLEVPFAGGAAKRR